MPIEGPLRDFGLHDIFQLLDLSRKTGVLTVTSASRDQQAMLTFDRGAVTAVSLAGRSNALLDHLLRGGRITEHELERARDERMRRGGSPGLCELLVATGKLSRRDLERHARLLMEEVVFELISWHGGYFSFEERSASEPAESFSIRVSTDSLLMEAAHQSDEWTRLRDTVPSLSLVPVLAEPAREDAELPAALDLGPREWELLAAIDGVADLRTLAARLMRSQLDVAKTVSDLVSARLLELRGLESCQELGAGSDADQTSPLEESLAALRAGAPDRALAAARHAITLMPEAAEARLTYARILARLGRQAEAAAELRHAMQLDALNAAVHLELGNVAARRGDHAGAVGCWERYLRMCPDAADVPRVRSALEAASRLRDILHEYADV